ncbi:MAG: ABC transporter permease, partial [Thermodesulfovibrionales bacterium]
GISAVFIKARSGVSVKELSRKIQKALPDVAVINIRESTLSVKRHLTSVLRAFMLPILVLLAMGTMILGIVFSMSVTERQREIGLLRAVGARRSDIFRIVLSESLIVTAIGGVFGILFGSALIFVFKNKIMESLKLLYIWPSPQVIAVVLTATAIAALAIGLLAGAYPALRAARMEPYHAIRSGEK